MADRGPSLPPVRDEEGRPLCAREACRKPIIGKRPQARFCSQECTTLGQLERKLAEKLARPERICGRDGCENTVGYDARRQYCSEACFKATRTEMHRKWVEENPERARELAKAYYDRHPEKAKARSAAYSRTDKAKEKAKEKRMTPEAKEERRQYDLKRRAENLEAELQRNKIYRDSHPEWHERRREDKFLKNFGITIAQYDKMVEERNNRCDICKEPETAKRKGRLQRLAVDHDHSKQLGEPGYIRGLLCQRCNLRLGVIEVAAWREKAEAYLTRTPPAIPEIGESRDHRWRNFRLTEEQYQHMVEACGNLCEICEQPETATYQGRSRNLAVDHDHKKKRGEEGWIRGLLCGRCNTQLAFLEAEEWLQAAEAYLTLVERE